ncbi:hypothetical protein APA22_26900 [Acetobacter pasteurianus IFO 3283-22]|uniref:Uncharacterized protein n=1 Tax=Acetobacter pasteurianus (strain NBRC 105184 / IFO 3283-01) TaxID=634452 RepID=C7JH47_ACEP3|nr:hypothetical protein APA01_26900 [Acetobacter pasteurianus IFO 3283-01]BAI03831.1 hypothetical protein APA03_26900 [Acetobacter pasteurianus IFO 3283-03]BAI06878.1 hypothetical protein APA07_26900 [Acetobacter pasteurianus IFO 3283-07]BAI09926.1 hypothetical protein APA22_26900 [Acetobacter pasteurianus IFO 3283-22]BAI12974.1 hypothetical protein APA26_26900 [Acetobacter pasteurianus IFO 3283-26]BAI16020.1 hypothetical protein APA32_26900 [Acetobacter pasteurianus IFO 3283-32]BAI19003.1 hy
MHLRGAVSLFSGWRFLFYGLLDFAGGKLLIYDSMDSVLIMVARPIFTISINPCSFKR